MKKNQIVGVLKSQLLQENEELIENPKETHPHLAEFIDLLPQINSESGRGLSSMACAFIDSQLCNILLAYLLEDEKEIKKLLMGLGAPLGSLAARTLCSYSLSLISKIEYQEINFLRKIRNILAHDHAVQFEDEQIVAICNQLRLAARAQGEEENNSARGLFASSAVAIMMNLTNRAHYVGQERIRPRLWKY